MDKEEELNHLWARFFDWSVIAAEPATNAANIEQETAAQDPGLVEMAETLVDALLREYAPTQAATAIALGAYLTLAEMINRYVPESDDTA